MMLALPSGCLVCFLLHIYMLADNATIIKCITSSYRAKAGVNTGNMSHLSVSEFVCQMYCTKMADLI